MAILVVLIGIGIGKLLNGCESDETPEPRINIIRTSAPIRPDMEIRFRNGVADTTYVYKGVE